MWKIQISDRCKVCLGLSSNDSKLDVSLKHSFEGLKIEGKTGAIELNVDNIIGYNDATNTICESLGGHGRDVNRHKDHCILLSIIPYLREEGKEYTAPKRVYSFLKN